MTARNPSLFDHLDATPPVAAPPVAPAPAGPGTDPGPPPAARLRVEVRRSAKRRKTVAWRVVGDTLVLMVPARLSAAEVSRWTAEALRRVERQRTADRIDLEARVRALADRYRLPRPRSVRWVDATTRWGSCTPATGAIRLNRVLATFPDWVLEVVIVHELAHLVHADHSPAFWALVHRHPRAERAKGYLIAKSGDLDPDRDPDVDVD